MNKIIRKFQIYLTYFTIPLSNDIIEHEQFKNCLRKAINNKLKIRGDPYAKEKNGSYCWRYIALC